MNIFSNKRIGFAESIADYLETHERYEELTKREVALEAINILLNDIGAAQGFLQAIGVNVDLYEYDLSGNKDTTNKICKRCRTVSSEKWWKCCPKHCTEKGTDVLCDTCRKELHPERGQREITT